MRGLNKMKILSPIGETIELKTSITLEEKMMKVNELIGKYETEINKNWNSNPVKYFLDSLSNYIVWHKEEEMKNKEDKEVMSHNKVRKLHKFDDKNINFSTLSESDKSAIGLESDKFDS